MDLVKYPRTPRLESSRLQPGDEDLEAIPFERIAGRHLVVEEKVDGGNAGLSFDVDGGLLLQSRGHFLTGGPREGQFDLFKAWARRHAGSLRAVLGSRYVLYGEWLYAKHTLFYDALPHYFLEFDVLDRETGAYLSTPARRRLLDGLPVASVPVLASRTFTSLRELTALVGPSLFKTPDWKDRLRSEALSRGQDPDRVEKETDPSSLAEGLYLKVEDDETVLARLKWVRAGFLQSVLQSDSHWMSRPVLPNQLRPGVDLFA